MTWGDGGGWWVGVGGLVSGSCEMVFLIRNFFLFLQRKQEKKDMDKELVIKYQEFEMAMLPSDGDRELMRRAVEAADGAYAPYSHFHVGAALRLCDGTVVCGNNQENAAYRSGLCAERTAVFAASAQRPEVQVYEALAIVGRNEAGRLCEASPCGACRQVLMEYEQRQGRPMRVLCYLGEERVRVFPSVASLLPFSFDF